MVYFRWVYLLLMEVATASFLDFFSGEQDGSEVKQIPFSGEKHSILVK